MFHWSCKIDLFFYDDSHYDVSAVNVTSVEADTRAIAGLYATDGDNWGTAQTPVSYLFIYLIQFLLHHQRPIDQPSTPSTYVSIDT